MSWIIHNSHDGFFRSPFGAVKCRTPITLRLQVASAQRPQSVHLRIFKNEREHNVEMLFTGERNGLRVYEAEITAPDEPGLLWYYFYVIKDGSVYYYGNNNHRLGGLGLIHEQVPPSYQITVYRENFEVPEWFGETVMYQIFVDRFANGCEDQKVLNPKKGSLLHGTWDDTPIYVREPHSSSIQRWNFFGGNLEGIIKKLTYLKELGVGVIYLNPIFEASSSHKYDTGDYLKIDPMFGTNEIFHLLCKKAGKLGIRIILDGVFSHTGSDSIYFNRDGNYPGIGAYQSPQSPYYHWFRFMDYPDVYESWWGIGTLPNVDELNPSYQEFILDGENSVLKQWMKLGASGWRLDVADELPDIFIKKLRAVMKKVDPTSVLIGEVWEDASNKISYGQKRSFLWGDELDTVMNYPFRSILLDFILGKTDARFTHQQFMSLYENYPAPSFYNCMNLIGSHDVPRILTLLGEGKPEEELSEAAREITVLTPAQRELAVRRLRLTALLQMTFPGVPCIYYGDEAGMEGYNDPFNRGPYPWGREDKELQEWYRELISLRNKHKGLRKGEWHGLYADGDIYGFLRKYQTELAAVFVNRSKTNEARVAVDLGKWSAKEWLDEFDNTKIQADKGVIQLNLPPLAGKVLFTKQ